MPLALEKTEFITTIRFSLPDDSDDLEKFFEDISADKSARAVVLKFTETESPNVVKAEKTRKILELVKNCPVPVIAAIKTSVSDFGFRLIEAAHLCVVAETTKFPNAKPASEALKLGLINKTAPFEEVETEAFALAEMISKLAPLAVRACLEAVTKGAEMPLEEGLKLETELFTQLFASEDMREGTRAFLEKRRPVFRGK